MSSPILKNAQWDSRIARDTGRLTEAARYPRIDASAGYALQLEPQAVKLGGVTAETQDANYATAGIAATYTIFDFGRRDARIHQADAVATAAEQSFLQGASDVSLQIIEAYF